MLKTNCFKLTTIIAILLVSLSLGDVASDPQSMGMGTARITYGSAVDAAILNPAVLGAQFQNSGAIRFIPVNSYSIGYWSDKLALTPYRELFTFTEDNTWQRLLTQYFNSSFRLKNLSPEETSEKVSKKIKGGTSIYAGTNIPLIGFAHWRLAFDLRNIVDVQVDLP
ncbi:MAG: hypothetical protein GX640_19335, partial [Fibrobacter sp.]|nr:hypothetical protein [Fibrobacter sp.]